MNDLQQLRWILKNKETEAFPEKNSNIQSKLSRRSLIICDFRILTERIFSDQKFLMWAHLQVLQYSKYFNPLISTF